MKVNEFISFTMELKIIYSIEQAISNSKYIKTKELESFFNEIILNNMATKNVNKTITRKQSTQWSHHYLNGLEIRSTDYQ